MHPEFHRCVSVEKQFALSLVVSDLFTLVCDEAHDKFSFFAMDLVTVTNVWVYTLQKLLLRSLFNWDLRGITITAIDECCNIGVVVNTSTSLSTILSVGATTVIQEVNRFFDISMGCPWLNNRLQKDCILSQWHIWSIKSWVSVRWHISSNNTEFWSVILHPTIACKDCADSIVFKAGISCYNLLVEQQATTMKVKGSHLLIDAYWGVVKMFAHTQFQNLVGRFHSYSGSNFIVQENL